MVHSIFVLGKLPSFSDPSAYLPAIISLQKIHLPTDAAGSLVQELVEEVKPIDGNDIVLSRYPARCALNLRELLPSIIGFLAGFLAARICQKSGSMLYSPQRMFMFAR